jgi:hypothetical protein
MNNCSSCKKECEWVKSTHQCKECINERKKNWKRKKKNRLCEYCKNEFIPNSIAKECSLKCRILNKIERKENGCWDWKGKITNAGYGEITLDRKYLLIHREAYKLFKGDIPNGLNVCHSCDNKKCCNPDHLWVGTQKENINDCVKKDRRTKGGWSYTREYAPRNTGRPGQKHHANKIRDHDVYEIRELLKQGLNQKQIANRYGVDQSVISKIKNGKAWSHI